MTIDHKYSVLQGYKDGVSEEVIAHYTNLKVMTRQANSSKGSKCSISKDILIEEYEKATMWPIAI